MDLTWPLVHFFDLEKAYGTTWNYGITLDLYDTLLFIFFLFKTDSEGKFRTPISDTWDQELKVPQGSILSVTLFVVKINSITSCTRYGVDNLLLVEDF